MKYFGILRNFKRKQMTFKRTIHFLFDSRWSGQRVDKKLLYVCEKANSGDIYDFWAVKSLTTSAMDKEKVNLSGLWALVEQTHAGVRLDRESLGFRP